MYPFLNWHFSSYPSHFNFLSRSAIELTFNLTFQKVIWNSFLCQNNNNKKKNDTFLHCVCFISLKKFMAHKLFQESRFFSHSGNSIVTIIYIETLAISYYNKDSKVSNIIANKHLFLPYTGYAKKNNLYISDYGWSSCIWHMTKSYTIK